MKKEGSLKITLSILVIILITLVSLCGVYIKSGGIITNKMPDYKYGMDLKDTNIINLEIKKEEATEESTDEDSEENTSEENKEESATEEKKEEVKTENIYTAKNYDKAKNIIEKRLKIVNIDQYTIRLNKNNGNMALELPTDLSASISQSLFEKGKFEIKIKDNDEVIADNNSIKDIEARINTQYANVPDYGSIVEMNFVFNKDATKKFEDMKNHYEMTYTKAEEKSKQDDSSEESEENSSGEIVDNTEILDREVGIYLDGSDLFSQTFTLEDFLKYASTGKLSSTIGQYTDDSKKLEEALQQANSTKSLVLTENLPFEYTALHTENIHSNINKKSIIIVFAVALAIMVVYLLVKNKLYGLFGGLTILGFISSLLLVIRFSNVALTISSIFAVGIMMLLQFIFVIKLLNKKVTTKSFNDNIVEFTKMTIPVFIMSLVMIFAKTLDVIGIGQVVFWGLIVFEVFNNIITRAILTNGKNK